MVLQTDAARSRESFDKYFNDDSWRAAAETICRDNRIAFRSLRRSPGGEHVVFFVDEDYVIKIYAPFRNGFAREKSALDSAGGKIALTLPQIVCWGVFEGFDFLVMTRIHGRQLSRDEWVRIGDKQRVSLLRQLAGGLRELHSLPVEAAAVDGWYRFIAHQTATCIERQAASGANPQWLEALPKFLAKSLPLLSAYESRVFLHGDVHFGNLRFVYKNGNWKISGLFDLADSLTGFHEYEFLAPTLLMIQGQGELQREFFRAYGYADADIDSTLRRRLMLLTVLYECSDLRKYALRLAPGAVDLTLEELERAIWPFDGL